MKKVFVLISFTLVLAGCSGGNPSPSISYYPSMEKEWAVIKSEAEKKVASKKIMEAIPDEEKEALYNLTILFKDYMNGVDLRKLASLFAPESPSGMMMTLAADMAEAAPADAEIIQNVDSIDAFENFRIVDSFENWRLLEVVSIEDDTKSIIQFAVIKIEEEWKINDLFNNDRIERNVGFLKEHVDNLISLDDYSTDGSFSFESEPGDFTFELDDSLK